MNGNIKNNTALLETKEFKLLFNLLEKAEQILSIINLSEASISKYNTLKKLTFEMLQLEFKPLEKKYLAGSGQPDKKNNNQNVNDESLYILYFQNVKKAMLIELILKFIQNYDNLNEEQDLNDYLNSLSEIFNLSIDTISNKTPDDISYEIKIEESNIPSLFTKVDQIFVNAFNNIKQMKMNFDNELIKLKEDYNRDLSELKNNINIDIQKSQNVDINKKNNLSKNKNNNKNKNKKSNEKQNYYLEKMSLIIDESYEKYKQQYPNMNNYKSIACKDGNFDEDIMKLEFIKNAFDDFFNKNNNNVFKGPQNRINNEINNIPYENKIMYNNELIREICSSLPEIQKENDIFHKNFNDLMNYIATNVEGKVI